MGGADESIATVPADAIVVSSVKFIVASAAMICSSFLTIKSFVVSNAIKLRS